MIQARQKIALLGLTDQIQENRHFPGQLERPSHQLAVVPTLELKLHLVERPPGIIAGHSAGIDCYLNGSLPFFQPEHLALKVGFKHNLEPAEVQPGIQRCVFQ